MRNPILRNGLSVLLFIVAAGGFYIELRGARAGLPGQHRLMLAAYALIAIYAAVSVVLRSTSARR